MSGRGLGLLLRLASPAVAFYYRFLFRGEAPDRLAAWAVAWERRRGYRNVPASAERWEDDYREGVWSYLADPEESAHYSVLVGYLRTLAPGGALLDVGCGEGILLDRLGPGAISRYLGVDVSAAAVEKAATRARPGATEAATFVAADAAAYRPESRFDAIVFNESLYYFDAPIAVVRRYLEHLEPGGVLAVSQFASRRARAISRRLAEELTLRDETTVRSRRGTWVVAIYAATPSSPSAPTPR